MRVFVLNSGRCGSTSFIRACSHMSNFSAAHESRLRLVGPERLDYPDNHIEADNRLSWLLGRLHQRFGDDAYYVHLQRDRSETIASFVQRRDFGIMQAYREGVLLGGSEGQDDAAQAADYLDTVTSNIDWFLRDKSHCMACRLERIDEDFPRFWQWIGAEGNLQAALGEWQVRHNASVDAPSAESL